MVGRIRPAISATLCNHFSSFQLALLLQPELLRDPLRPAPPSEEPQTEATLQSVLFL
jgi:hypothetical protein